MEAKSLGTVLIGFICAMIACILAFSASKHWSYTYDEPAHVAPGMELLEKGTYMYEAHHPPLQRLASAVLLYATGVRGVYKSNYYDDGYEILKGNSEEEFRQRLALSRLGVLPFLFMSTLIVFYWTKTVSGVFSALISAVLFFSIPSVLAHGVLATTDSALCACLLAFTFSLKIYRQTPNLKNKILLGISAALSLAAKMSAIPFMFFILLASLLTGKGTKKIPLISLMLAIIVLWGTYRFEISPLVQSKRANELIDILPNPVFSKIVRTALEVPLPLARYMIGIASTARHAKEGHGAVFMGELKEHGSFEFFPVVFSIKTPLPFLCLLFTLGVLLLSSQFRKVTAHEASYPLLSAILIFAFTLFSTINIGLRHILPVYGLFAVAIGLSIFRIRKFLFIGTVMALFQLYIVWQRFPYYISYYNEIPKLFGKEGYEIACNSDYDWGQETSLAVDYLQSLGINDYILANGTIARENKLAPDSKGYIVTNRCMTGADGGLLPERTRFTSATIFKEIGDVTVIHKLQ